MAPQLAEYDHTTFTTSSQLKKAAHLTNGFFHSEDLRDGNPEQDLSDDEFATISIRNLVHDLCAQNGGGHGGSAVGMAAIGVALWKYEMRYNPCNPEWFDRDRFVLSNGHASMFLYSMNHLVGYDAWTMEQLKGYGAAKLDGYTTISHAHPEIEVPGVEVTTGPLGQGIANSVGLAIASKNLAATYNKPGFDVVKSRIYCTTGDGCLMEGVALEAIALAGHLQLDNLVLLYDNNQVTCDGPLEWINSEDINNKMRACGWEVLDVLDGTNDVQTIVSALRYARRLVGKPIFVNIRTVIGAGTAVAGTAKAHHGVFDKESIAKSKALTGLDPNETHVIPQRALDFFRERRAAGTAHEKAWSDLLVRYAETFPELHKSFAARRRGSCGDFVHVLSGIDSQKLKGLATRESNGIILEKLWKACPALCGGGADLANSNKITYSETDVFHPLTGFKGRYLRHGIREHAMASIANGLAAYSPGTFLPITATFLIFYIYAAPGVRMGALSGLQVIHIATHDSFAEGQNGPTHQPVEIDSLYRAMPNLQYLRPCDAEELIGCWQIALSARNQPSILSLGRDPVGHVPNTSRDKVRLGAYVVSEEADADVTIASCGTNLHYVFSAAELLKSRGIKSRIVSAPSLDLFQLQDEQYRATVFPLDGKPVISVEEYVATTWARYVTASIGITSFGYSASNESNYQRFGLDGKGIEGKVVAYLDKLQGQNARTAGWHQL